MSEIEKKPESLPSKAIDGFAASVELPEGHQLIIGEMPPGTVVEVATWQGVGRPDETANRFLLTTDGPGLQKRKLKDSKAIEGAMDLEPSIEQKPVFAAAAVQTEHDDQFLGVKFKPTAPSSSNVLKVDAPEKSKWNRIGRSVFSVVAVLAIFSVALNMLGVSITVPTDGAQTSFGKTSESLVFYKRSTAPENNVALVSSTVVDGKRVTLIGASTNFGSDGVGLSTAHGIITVDPNTIVGKSFLVLPYIGSILKPLFK
jgi:hypothetical protein